MARASTYTMLGLDKCAKIIGMNPFHFNGGTQIDLPSGKVIYPIHNAQNNIWAQYDWQNDDQVSREQLAQSIADAEFDICRLIGYLPKPDWTYQEIHDLAQPFVPDYRGLTILTSVDTNPPTIQLNRARFIAGGVRKADAVQLGATVTYTDTNTDGWKEHAFIDINNPSGFPVSELKLYFPGTLADRTYEIRDPYVVSNVAGVVRFRLDAFLMVDPDLWEVASSNDTDGKSIDMADPTVFVTTVDCYHEYNDTTQAHAIFDGYDAYGSKITQSGFILDRYDDRFVVPVMGTYNTTTLQWDRDASLCQTYRRASMNYYSGTDNPDTQRKIERAIAFLAVARLDKMFYTNTNATSKLYYYQEDLATISRESFRLIGSGITSNPFGTRRGEYMAWSEILNFVPRVVGGAAV